MNAVLLRGTGKNMTPPLIEDPTFSRAIPALLLLERVKTGMRGEEKGCRLTHSASKSGEKAQFSLHAFGGMGKVVSAMYSKH